MTATMKRLRFRDAPNQIIEERAAAGRWVMRARLPKGEYRLRADRDGSIILEEVMSSEQRLDSAPAVVKPPLAVGTRGAPVDTSGAATTNDGDRRAADMRTAVRAINARNAAFWGSA